MKYKTVVIDLPWSLVAHGSSNMMTGKIDKKLPYKSMTDKQILNFPINDFVDDNCNLFIWTTHYKLPFVFELVKKWGFKYHCMITWVKNTGITMRGIFRNSEFVVFAYNGKFTIPSKGKALRTVINAKTTGHSSKPFEFYEEIKSKTEEPRIDIFARKRHDGFEAWGDEVEPTIQTTLGVKC